MKIAQKIRLSFTIIFVLVFTLGATAVLSLRQIYKGVYESLRRDVPAIHESALLGIQLAQAQNDLEHALSSTDPKDWDQYLQSSQDAKKIIERFSIYVITPKEQEILEGVKNTYEQMQQLSSMAKSELEISQDNHRQFFKKREMVLTQISFLIQAGQQKLQQEQDLFLVQSHYLPLLTHLANFRTRIINYSVILDQSISGFLSQQSDDLQETASQLKKIRSVLGNYTLISEEQNRYDVLTQEVGSFITLAGDIFAQYQAFHRTLQKIGELQYKIQGLLVNLIEQERHQVARKTGLGVTFIEDIPATRVASFLGIYASNREVALGRYLLTRHEEDLKRYEQLKSEAQKSLDEYSQFIANRQGPTHQGLLKKVDHVSETLFQQDRQILSFHQEQKQLMGELQKLLIDFEQAVNGFISQESEKVAKKKEIAPVRKESFPRIELVISLLESVCISIGNLSRYSVTRDVSMKEVYDTKILEILQDLDRLNGLLPEGNRDTTEGMGTLFTRIQTVANDLIEASDHFWTKNQDKKGLVLSQQKSLLEVLDEERDRNSIALDQLEKKVVLINGVIIGIVLLIIIGGIVVIIYTTRSITRPIQELSQGAKLIGGGQLNYRIPLKTGDELEELAGEFNKMTHELQGLYTHLELKVEQRTRELENVNVLLSESNKELDDFTYIVSHDLKEPLRGIDAFSRFILQDYAGKLDPKAKEYLESIQEATKRMTQLIENLLDLSRITRQQNPLESTHLTQVLEEVRKNLIYAVTEKKVDLSVRDLPTLVCDRVRIQQVFHNLISNAIKYNDKEKPMIEVGSEQKDRFYQFYVRDNGMGIKKEYFDKVFKLFQRLPGSERVEGTGAGLVIVKKIIERHGGKIWLESSPGGGTTFFFTLPLEPVRATAKEPEYV